jgi:hypothetical protein
MRRILVSVAAALAVTGAIAAGQGLPRADADALARKLDAVVARGAVTPPNAARPLRTAISEREVNAYFLHRGPDFLPAGVVNPRLTLADNSRVEARAIVDFDAIRKSKERGWTDPLAWVTGSVEVLAIGRIRAANGQGVLDIESAKIGAVPIPKTLLQELVSHYSKSADNPNGFSLDQPFALPHQIRQVDLQRGAAVIVQ